MGGVELLKNSKSGGNPTNFPPKITIKRELQEFSLQCEF